MSTTSTAAQTTDQQHSLWLREQLKKANGFLAQKGIIPSKLLDQDSRVLAPAVAIWKIQADKPQRQTFWVITGDLPTDFVDEKVAANAREAMRHFSMAWQLKADNLIQSGITRDKTQAKFAQLLINRAQDLYQLQANDQLWQN